MTSFIICDEKGLGLKGTGNMSDDSISKIIQTHESRIIQCVLEGLQIISSLSVKEGCD